jgi:hypothetical protein
MPFEHIIVYGYVAVCLLYIVWMILYVPVINLIDLISDLICRRRSPYDELVENVEETWRDLEQRGYPRPHRDNGDSWDSD